MTDDTANQEEIGYRRPPVSTRFRKGRSGNPRGRPGGRRSALPYDAVLGQMVTIREEGVERRVTAAEAFVLHVTRKGLQGDSGAARSAMKAIEAARDSDRGQRQPDVTVITMTFVRPGSVNAALEPLRMARKLDRYRDTARMRLEPWIVQAALAALLPNLDRRTTPALAPVVEPMTKAGQAAGQLSLTHRECQGGSRLPLSPKMSCRSSRIAGRPLRSAAPHRTPRRAVSSFNQVSKPEHPSPPQIVPRAAGYALDRLLREWDSSES